MTESTNKRHEKWKHIIEAQEASGLSQEKFCEQENISTSSLGCYRGLFRGKKKIKKPIGTCMLVNSPKSVSTSEIRLTLPNGFQCTFPCDFEPSRLKEWVGALLFC